MKKNTFKMIVLLLAVLVISAGCATNNTNNENNTNHASQNEATNEETNSNDTSSTNEETNRVRVISHALGEAEIEGIPQRIVALEWTYVEDLLALGITPVGVADIEGYRAWVNAKPELPEDVVDVGSRAEPNLETIMSLQPDLIIATSFRVKNSYDQLSSIAPTIVFDPYSEENMSDQYAQMEASFLTIADVIGKKEAGEEYLAELHQLIDEGKAKLEEAGLNGSSFVLTQAFSNQNAAVFRLFNDNSIAGELMNRLGLVNAHQSEKVEMYGFTQASVESLPAVQDAHFFYAIQDDDNIIENQLKDNDIWNSLAFVQEDKMYGTRRRHVVVWWSELSQTIC